MVEWKKLSGSINYYIRNVWKEELLKSNEDLLEDYLKDMEGEEAGEYKQLEERRKNFKVINLDEWNNGIKNK